VLIYTESNTKINIPIFYEEFKKNDISVFETTKKLKYIYKKDLIDKKRIYSIK